MIDKQSYEQGFNKGYIYGIEAENQNFIRNLEEYLYGLEKRREKGDIVIGYWQVKKMIEEIIEQCKLDKGGQAMTKEQEESIEYLNESILIYKNTIPKISQAIETVLNMLKEKDSEIERLEQTLARNIARNVTSSMKKSAKSKEDLEMLNQGWQIELEKKDKQIDLMAEFLGEKDMRYYKKEEGGEILGIMRRYRKEDWKQYFERKSEE